MPLISPCTVIQVIEYNLNPLGYKQWYPGSSRIPYSFYKTMPRYNKFACEQ